MNIVRFFRSKVMHAEYSRVRGGTVPMLNIRERNVIERIVAKDALKFGFMVWLVMRVALSIWGMIVMVITPAQLYINVLKAYPFQHGPGESVYRYVLGLWSVYDTNNYRMIAEQGYDANPILLTAFFPGYPMLIKAARFIFLGDTLFSSLVIP